MWQIGLFAHALFWFVFAAVVACIEIEAEGKFGWAEKMPTWYRTTGLAASIYGRVMGGRPLTGYHAFIFFFPVLLFHAPFFMGVPWDAPREWMAWSMYFVWCTLWDFLWLVLNPHYGLRKFKREHIWWHAGSPWIFGLFPRAYLAGVALSLACAASASIVHGGYAPLVRQGMTIAWFALMSVVLVDLAPRYHRWKVSMHERDERAKVFDGTRK